MKHLLRISLAVTVAVTLAGCGGGSPNQSNRATGDRATGGKDRGDAAMLLGTQTWQADRAQARLANGKLTISASHMDTSDGKVKRQELSLSIDAYNGPGDYKTGFSGSRFLGVGFDVGSMKADAERAEAEKAEGGDQAVLPGALKDAISGANHVMLSNAQVSVTAANDTEITGTFSWQPPAGLDKPAIKNGTFRALLKK